ncbi:MAG: hypothetical protein VX938_05770, partial [Myxococcota bacterium]|nr:hypothetical protein [Myxococcota bacterium]
MVAKVSRVLFLVHCILGPVLILWLALEPAARIGEGRLDEWIRRIELIDFHWWIVLGAAVLWAIPLLLAIA